MGATPTDPGLYTAVTKRPFLHPPPPPWEGRCTCRMQEGPPERDPGASRNAAAQRGRVAALGARFAWSTGCPCATGAKALDGASTGVASPATRGTAVVRGGRGARPKATPHVTLGRQVLVTQDQRAGAAAMSSWLGGRTPVPMPFPDVLPPKTLGARSPYRFSEKRGDGWCFAYGKRGVQICIFTPSWAVQSPDQLCNSF